MTPNLATRMRAAAAMIDTTHGPGMMRAFADQVATLETTLARAENRLAMIVAICSDEHTRPAVVVAFPVDIASRNHV